LSDRCDKPFVPVNMATIPAGLAESTLFGHEKGSFTSAVGAQVGWCEAADGGTLFLDEISEMDMSLQPKLLRFLQESTIQRVGSAEQRRVDVRVITATNRDITEMVKTGQMREDLFYRLHVVPIHLPPLRERPEDIEQLAQLFLARAARRYGRDVPELSDEALDLLTRCRWPGNVRQLENTIERMVIFARGRSIEACEIPPEIQMSTLFVDVANSVNGAGYAGSNGGGGAQGANGAGSKSANGHGWAGATLSPIQRHERIAIIDALQRVQGNVVDAARLLGLGQATVYRKIKQYEIPHERRRRQSPR
jgi:DNA-binding NtrC family response regulator